ncbi:hypothetical protein AGMMS49950_01760 [Endomicrobiia bacterium]|nr:hypothetical protein AGMMS49950_01760 [Endomicrobiia bacterium]
MKQKKKASGSGGMGLVLMGVKKAFDKTKDSKEVRKDRVKYVSKEKIEYREYCKDDVLSTLGQYLNILSQEIATISAKVVDIDIGY